MRTVASGWNGHPTARAGGRRGAVRRVPAWLVFAGAVFLIHFLGVASCAWAPRLSTEGPVVKKDIGYSPQAPSARQTLDIYLPREARDAPVLIFVHGGGWRRGSKDLSPHERFAGLFPPEGFITVVPNYRLSDVARFPAQVEDVAAAFAWTYRNIQAYGGDPDRIFLSGHSAGGHLVSLLCLDSRYLDRLDIPDGAIKGVLALSAVYDIPEMQDRSLRTLVEPAFGSDLSVWQEASPMNHVRSGLPPFLVLYAQRDPKTLQAQARQFADALKKRKNDRVVLVELQREGYLSVILRTRAGKNPAVPHMLKFMNGLLGAGAP